MTVKPPTPAKGLSLPPETKPGFAGALESITIKHTPKLPGLSPGGVTVLQTTKLANDGMRGWRIRVRGERIYFISPQGWEIGKPRAQWKGMRTTVYEMPREDVILHWSVIGETNIDALDNITDYTSPPFGEPFEPVGPAKGAIPEESILARLPPAPGAEVS